MEWRNMLYESNDDEEFCADCGGACEDCSNSNCPCDNHD